MDHFRTVMPEDSLYPSLPQISKIVNLTANGTSSVNMLGGLVILNGYTLNVAALSSTFFGAIYVAGEGELAGSVVEEVAADSIIMLAFGGGEIFSMKVSSIPGLQAILDGKVNTSQLGTTEGKIPVLGAGGKLAASLLPTLSLTDFVPVENQTQRLALNSADVYGKLVKQADNGRSYGLPTGNTASNNAHWIDLGDTSITAADINDASAAGRALLTAADAAAQRAVLGAVAASSVPFGLENPQCLARVHDKIQRLDLGVPGNYFGMAGFGDSMVGLGYMLGYVFEELQEIYGCGAIFSPGFGNNYNGSAPWTLAGGATTPSTTYTYDPGSNLIVLPSGATATRTQPPVSSLLVLNSTSLTDSKTDPRKNTPNMPDGIARVKVYVIKESGAGSITATLSQTGYSNVTGTLDANAADGLGVIELIPNNRASAMTLQLASSGGTVRCFGVIYWGDSGVFQLTAGVGGSTMTQQLACLSGGTFKAAYRELLTELGISLVWNNQRVSDTTGYPEFFAAWEERDIAQIVLGEVAMASESGIGTAAVNAYLRTECQTRGIGFLDMSRTTTVALMTELGWNLDNAHNESDANRYFGSMILDAVGRFRTAGSTFGGGWLDRAQLGRERTRLKALDEMRTTRIYARTGFTLDGASNSTYSAPTVTTERGFRFLSTAALGHAAGRMGVLISGGTSMDFRHDIAVSANGYRNVNIVAGIRAFVLIGTSSTTVTTLAGLTQKCFGIEFALGSDVGSPDGITGTVMRLVMCDGTNTTYSSWVRNGTADPNTGFGFAIRYAVDTKTLFLYGAVNSGLIATNPRLLATMDATALFTGLTSAGTWANGCIVAADAGNVPAATGEMSWVNLSATWGTLAPPYL